MDHNREAVLKMRPGHYTADFHARWDHKGSKIQRPVGDKETISYKRNIKDNFTGTELDDLPEPEELKTKGLMYIVNERGKEGTAKPGAQGDSTTQPVIVVASVREIANRTETGVTSVNRRQLSRLATLNQPNPNPHESTPPRPYPLTTDDNLTSSEAIRARKFDLTLRKRRRKCCHSNARCNAKRGSRSCLTELFNIYAYIERRSNFCCCACLCYNDQLKR